MADKMVKFVISLTTIPPGFVHVRECLQSLLVQAADVAAISLHIPQSYKRFACAESHLPGLPKAVNLRVVDEDLGPATKILPLVVNIKDKMCSFSPAMMTRFMIEVGRKGF